MDCRMRNRMRKGINVFLSCTGCKHVTPNHCSDNEVDVREEYAHAFRTESYLDFWTRVITLSNGEATPTCKPTESTAAARLPSYRLFAEQLLEPDQYTVTRVLSMTRNPPSCNSLLLDYFAQTSKAFLLCSSLLKHMDQTRTQFQSFKTTLRSLMLNPSSSTSNFSKMFTHLTQFANSSNPFSIASPSSNQIEVIQSECTELLKRIELTRDKTRSKLKLMNRLKRGSSIFLVAITASLSVLLVTHGLAFIMAVPGFVAASLSELSSAKNQAKVIVQLDTAAKGTYILNKDLETISRLVTRLHDEMEHMRAMVKFWLERGEERAVQANGEVTGLLKKKDCSFSDQLDELEEHLYLCFMNINRARNLVVKEVAKLIHE